MGAILEKTEETGPFGVEVRGESCGLFGVPAAELGAFVSAVAQALGHPAVSGAKVAEQDPWVVTQNGGDYVVRGPVITFGTDEIERKPVQSVELVYRDAYWLARALEPLVRS